jgi:hypothetical protein
MTPLQMNLLSHPFLPIHIPHIVLQKERHLSMLQLLQPLHHHHQLAHQRARSVVLTPLSLRTMTICSLFRMRRQVHMPMRTPLARRARHPLSHVWKLTMCPLLLARCTRWCILHLMRWVQSFALCETLSTDHIHRHIVVLVSPWVLQTACHNKRTQVLWPVRAVPSKGSAILLQNGPSQCPILCLVSCLQLQLFVPN